MGDDISSSDGKRGPRLRHLYHGVQSLPRMRCASPRSATLSSSYQHYPSASSLLYLGLRNLLQQLVYLALGSGLHDAYIHIEEDAVHIALQSMYAPSFSSTPRTPEQLKIAQRRK
jgi:hypothetical protein